MTKKEAVIIEAYTGVCMLKGEDRNLFYKYINQLMGRKVYMYEILALEREIKEKAKPDFIKICKNMEKKTKTHKFRAMTCGEFCRKIRFCGECPMYDKRIYDCSIPNFEDNDLFRNQEGKYILIEVTE